MPDKPDAAAAQTSPVVTKQMASAALMYASIAKQKTSVQHQLGLLPPAVPSTASTPPASTPPAASSAAPPAPAKNTGDDFFTNSWSTPAVYPVPNIVPTCTAMAEAELKPLIESAAKAHSLQVELVRAVVKHESDGYPCAISDKGALGLMQLMPEVAQQFNVDPLDPAQNLAGGTQYLKQLLDRYKGDVRLAVAAYNAGPLRVDTDKKVPDIPETIAYVDAILKDLTQIPAGKK